MVALSTGHPSHWRGQPRRRTGAGSQQAPTQHHRQILGPAAAPTHLWLRWWPTPPRHCHHQRSTPCRCRCPGRSGPPARIWGWGGGVSWAHPPGRRTKNAERACAAAALGSPAGCAQLCTHLQCLVKREGARNQKLVDGRPAPLAVQHALQQARAVVHAAHHRMHRRPSLRVHLQHPQPTQRVSLAARPPGCMARRRSRHDAHVITHAAMRASGSRDGGSRMLARAGAQQQLPTRSILLSTMVSANASCCTTSLMPPPGV